MEAPEPTELDCVAALYRRHQRSLYRWAARILPNAADAEDVVQEAFLKLALVLGRESSDPDGFRSHPGMPLQSVADGRLRAWLFHTVSRLAFNMIRRGPRRKSREATYHQSVAVPPLDPPRLYQRSHTIQQVWEVLDRLPKRVRLLLYLWAAQKPYKEIGHVLGIDPQAVGKALTRARRAFRAEYRQAHRADVTFALAQSRRAPSAPGTHPTERTYP